MKRLTQILPSIVFMLLCLFTASEGFAKPRTQTKLIVVISYDQMRGDYVERYQHLFGEQGFKRIIREGTHSPLCYYNHISNMTCPGHAVILSGCYPSKTGIVSNDFFDSPSSCACYCVEDSLHPTLGNERVGRSPALMKAPSLSDYIKKAYPKSKTISLALKDRAAILMSGYNNKNTVLWFDWKINAFSTSTYYKKPQWLPSLNTTYPYTAYQDSIWNTIVPDSLAVQDSMVYEGNFPGGDCIFPHQLGNAAQKSYSEAVLTSPFGMQFLFNASKFALEHEKLGKDNAPDILTIGVSTTDFLGHIFGPDSRELQELYVHADHILADFLSYLDKSIGANSYTVVITSDHGVGPIPEYIKTVGKIGVDAGRINEKEFLKTLNTSLNAAFGITQSKDSWISIFEPPSLFLNDAMIKAHAINKNDVIDALCTIMKSQEGIAVAIPTATIHNGILTEGWTKEMLAMYRNALYPERTGEIMFMTKPYWIWGPKPATHGTPYDYDTYVPLMMMGAGIPKNTIIKGRTEPVDLAPTLANILGIHISNVDGKILDLSGKDSPDSNSIPPKFRRKR